jgi:hypothetical protein
MLRYRPISPIIHELHSAPEEYDLLPAERRKLRQRPWPVSVAFFINNSAPTYTLTTSTNMDPGSRLLLLQELERQIAACSSIDRDVKIDQKAAVIVTLFEQSNQYPLLLSTLKTTLSSKKISLVLMSKCRNLEHVSANTINRFSRPWT